MWVFVGFKWAVVTNELQRLSQPDRPLTIGAQFPNPVGQG